MNEINLRLSTAARPMSFGTFEAAILPERDDLSSPGVGGMVGFDPHQRARVWQGVAIPQSAWLSLREPPPSLPFAADLRSVGSVRV
jgi:hypothetical protein